MNYVYHINGEERAPTKEEWQQLAKTFLETAGLEMVSETENVKPS